MNKTCSGRGAHYWNTCAVALGARFGFVSLLLSNADDWS